jgi:coproporphyrinogen III oxidase-like Fe-S oxidoreductase
MSEKRKKAAPEEPNASKHLQYVTVENANRVLFGIVAGGLIGAAGVSGFNYVNRYRERVEEEKAKVEAQQALEHEYREKSWLLNDFNIQEGASRLSLYRTATRAFLGMSYTVPELQEQVVNKLVTSEEFMHSLTELLADGFIIKEPGESDGPLTNNTKLRASPMLDWIGGQSQESQFQKFHSVLQREG